jgi:hypothetical protein
MANTYKTAAQLNPSASTWSNLYTVPSSTQTVISNIHVCNYGNDQATFRIALRPDGESLSAKHYVFYGLNIGSLDTIQLGDGITMDSSDLLDVWASTASVSFNMSYAEVTE